MNVQSVMDEIQRDRWGRPLIEPPEGGKPIAYTRVSTLSKSLDKQEALTKWKQRMTAVGMSRRPDLLALVQATREDDRKVLDDACEQALAAAKSQAAANTGTALHAFTERIDEGVPLEDIVASDVIKADLAAYRDRMAGVATLAKETFVVQDEVRCAGTFDRLLLVDGVPYVADIKTGQHEPNYPHGVAVQTAIYARGTGYHPTKKRTASLADIGVDLDRAILIHLPAGKATCELYWLDIAAGWEMAQTATRVRAWHSTKPIERIG
jgi:hypothetical protein